MLRISTRKKPGMRSFHSRTSRSTMTLPPNAVANWTATPSLLMIQKWRNTRPLCTSIAGRTWLSILQRWKIIPRSTVRSDSRRPLKIRSRCKSSAPILSINTRWTNGDRLSSWSLWVKTVATSRTSRASFCKMEFLKSTRNHVCEKCKSAKQEVFDPRYGKFEITSTMLAAMVSNFDKGVRGVVPALDYKHESDNVAAGWFKSYPLSTTQNFGPRSRWLPKGESFIRQSSATSARNSTINTQTTKQVKSMAACCSVLGSLIAGAEANTATMVQLSEIENEDGMKNSKIWIWKRWWKKYCQRAWV